MGVRTYTIVHPLATVMPDGTIVTKSEHRELFDEDDNYFDRTDISESQTRLLVATCASVNDGTKLDAKARRILFRRMSTPTRDYVFFKIIDASDPNGTVTRSLQCNRCNKKFTSRAIESVIDDKPVMDAELRPSAEMFDSAEDVFGRQLGMQPAIQAFSDVVLDGDEWKMLESERKFVLTRPVEISITNKDTRQPEIFIVTGLRIRIATGEDEEAISKELRRMSLPDATRELIAKRIVSADGVPDSMIGYIRSTNFIKLLQKADQMAIKKWDSENCILKAYQFSTCPHCFSQVPNMRDPSFFF